MKKLLLFSTTLIASGLCLAQDIGRVLSSTPVMQQVAVPRQVCAAELPPAGATDAATSTPGVMPPAQDPQRCGIQTFYENRPVAYTVVYEFAGKQYTVQMPNDPGPQVQLQIAPVGAAPPMAASVGNAASPQAVYPQQAPYVVVDQTVYSSYYPGYPAYYGAPYSPYYYPPVGVSLGFGWGGGYRRWR